MSLKEPCSKPAAELEYGCHMDIGVNGDLSTLYWRQNVPFEAGSVACNVTFGTLLSQQSFAVPLPQLQTLPKKSSPAVLTVLQVLIRVQVVVCDFVPSHFPR